MTASTIETPSTGKTIRLVVIDDHPVVRNGLSKLLTEEPDLVVAAQAGGAEAGLLQVAAADPDVVVLDIRLGDGMTGIAACRTVRDQYPQAGVVVLTSYPQDVDGALAAGAHGVVLKRSDTTHLLRAIRRAADGESYEDPALAEPRTTHEDEFGLTDAELRVLNPLAVGASNEEIAGQLCLSIHTVKSHVRSICTKLDVANRTEAAVVALHKGLIAPLDQDSHTEE